ARRASCRSRAPRRGPSRRREVRVPSCREGRLSCQSRILRTLARTTATRSWTNRRRRIPKRAATPTTTQGPTSPRRPRPGVRPRTWPLGLVVAFDRRLQLRRALEPIALAQPFEGGLERLVVADCGRDPAVAPDVTRGSHVREQVRDLTLLGGQLDRHVDGLLARHDAAEDLVLPDLEDGEVAPRPVLVGLGKREGQLGDPPLDRRRSHGPILTEALAARRQRRTLRP